MSTTIDVAARVAARLDAREVVRLAYSMAESMSEDAALAFWREIQNAVDAKLPKAVEPEKPADVPMSNWQAKYFESLIIPYGKYSGWRVGSLIDDPESRQYLDWLVDAPDEFKADLRRYLLSERGKARMEGRAS